MIRDKKIFIPLDVKSLFFNLQNDNTSGNTATVATAVVQGKGNNKREQEKIYTIGKQINFPDEEEIELLLNKKSKSITRINNVYVFDKIKINGLTVDTGGKCFCMYLKEEIDQTKSNYGRIKLHYPLTTNFIYKNLDVDNKFIVKRLSEELSDFAFVCQGFEFSFNDDTINFIVDVFPKDMPLSKVFIRKNASCMKMMVFPNEKYDYDKQIKILKKIHGNNFSVSDFNNVMEQSHNKVNKMAQEYLLQKGILKSDIKFTKNDFPYAPYDLSYQENNSIKYVVTYFSFTKHLECQFQDDVFKFINDFSKSTLIFYVSDMGCEKKVNVYTLEELREQTSFGFSTYKFSGGII